jgi:dsRNA-specific ribonuclease
LENCIRSFDLRNDPYIARLRERPETQAQAGRVLQTGKTFCSEELRKFLSQSKSIYEELGGWATDSFIESAIEGLRRSIEYDESLTGLDCAERVFLLELLDEMAVPEAAPESLHLSPKLETLIAFLEKMDKPTFSGLIFAKERATVGMLTRILSIHPSTKERFRCASYVGWSSSTHRKHLLGDLLSREMQTDTLSDFRAGRKNLIVATEVLEEGLDISSCSLVICYNLPANLKSFVQRRGRARHQESTYGIMIPTEASSVDLLQKWQELEIAMIEAYLDDQRRLREAWELETIDEMVADYLFVRSTNACLSAEDAMQHLHHFCDLLPVSEHVDNRPTFSFEENANGLVRGTVTLPNCVHPAVRRGQGKAWWRTERAARKEAAFRAYEALYHYGLVNDNLLPRGRTTQPRFAEEEKLPAIVKASAQYDPYVDLAHAWMSPHLQLYRTTVKITNAETGVMNEDLSMSIILPKSTPMPDPINLYWENDVTLLATFTTPEDLEGATVETVKAMQSITAIFLQAPSSRLQPETRDYVALFAPIIPHEQFIHWISRYDGSDKAVDVYARDALASPIGIIRDRAKFSEPRLFRKWLEPDNGKRGLEIECQSIPKRRNFLQTRSVQVPGEDADSVPKVAAPMPAGGCTIDRLPASKAMFGLLMSALLDRFEATMVAHRLNETILKSVGIHNLDHVLTAITTPIAQANTHYQLYEFFGDSVLKFTVGCHLFFANSMSNEGVLSKDRDDLIRNTHLARAALDTGLDSFILVNRFTPRKWNAPRIKEKMTYEPKKRDIAMKVLADVVEALIGAAYMDGGIHKAQACLHRFLPEITLFTSEISSVIGPSDRGTSKLIESHRMTPLLGYTFKDASLLAEALTHASCQHDGTTQSYQRLEFLGDAVLDMIIVSVLAAHPDQLSQGTMTLIKHAVVNANLLAFLCMDHGIADESIDLNKSTNGSTKLTTRHEQIHLWRFLRVHGSIINPLLEASISRYQSLRDQIRHALTHNTQYPWELFASLNPDKFISDIVESTIGAIFVDSHGDLDECYAFTERIGLLAFLRRVISDDVNVQHPRNAAQNMIMSSGNLVFKSRRVEKKGVPATYRSTAMLDKKEIALVEGCASAEEAEIKVSHIVIARLKKEKESEEMERENDLE